MSEGSGCVSVDAHGFDGRGGIALPKIIELSHLEFEGLQDRLKGKKKAVGILPSGDCTEVYYGLQVEAGSILFEEPELTTFEAVLVRGKFPYVSEEEMGRLLNMGRLYPAGSWIYRSRHESPQIVAKGGNILYELGSYDLRFVDIPKDPDHPNESLHDRIVRLIPDSQKVG
jgi:hypothetical protein